MRIFSVDSPFYKFMVKFWDVVKLNFMWLLFSLPIVTIGAATVAVYSVTLKMVDEHEGHVVRQFLVAFKENWKQGIPLGLISLMVTYFAYLNFEFFNKLEDSPVLFLIAGIMITFFSLIGLTYAFPLSARYHNSLFKTIQNSMAISLRYFLKTVLLWVIVALLLFLFMFNPTLMFMGFLIGPVSVFLTVSGFANRFFKEIEKKAEQG